METKARNFQWTNHESYIIKYTQEIWSSFNKARLQHICMIEWLEDDGQEFWPTSTRLMTGCPIPQRPHPMQPCTKLPLTSKSRSKTSHGPVQYPQVQRAKEATWKRGSPMNPTCHFNLKNELETEPHCWTHQAPQNHYSHSSLANPSLMLTSPTQILTMTVSMSWMPSKQLKCTDSPWNLYHIKLWRTSLRPSRTGPSATRWSCSSPTQIKVSYYVAAENVNLFIHVPMAPANSLLCIFKFHPFLLLFIDTHSLLPTPDNSLLTLSKGLYNATLLTGRLLVGHFSTCANEMVSPLWAQFHLSQHHYNKDAHTIVEISPLNITPKKEKHPSGSFQPVPGVPAQISHL